MRHDRATTRARHRMFEPPEAQLRRRSGLIGAAFLAAALIGTADAGTPCAPDAGYDLAFVMDGSGSIDAADFALQKAGLIAAFQRTTPELVPRDGTVGFALVQFANGQTRVEVPYRCIESAADVTQVVSQIEAIGQIGGGTNAGDGVLAAMNALAAGQSGREQRICLSTDGVVNEGVSIGQAVSQAQSAGLDAFGVIGIRCPGEFEESDLQSEYAPHVFGGGEALMVNSSIEFADTVGRICFGEPVRLIGMEVNQSVQTWNNDIVLVEGKETWVRLHLEPVDMAVTETPAAVRLRARRGGVDLGRPVSADNAEDFLARHDAVGRRDDWDGTLNFNVPRDWTRGNVTFILEGAIDCTGSAIGADCELDVSFVEVDPAELVLLAASYTGQGGVEHEAPSIGDLRRLAGRLTQLYPQASIDVRFETTSFSGTPITNSTAMLGEVRSWRRWTDWCWGIFCDTKYQAVVKSPIVGPCTPPLMGSCPTNGSAYCGGLDGWLTYNGSFGYGHHTLAHELGHSLGFSHANPGCCASVGGCAIDIPFSVIGMQSCSSPGGGVQMGFPGLGPLGTADAEVWGLDTFIEADNGEVRGDGRPDIRVIDPNETFAVMGYCAGIGSQGRRWIDGATYERLAIEIDQEFLAPEIPGGTVPGRRIYGRRPIKLPPTGFSGGGGGGDPEPVVPVILVRGLVDLDTGELHLDPFLRLNPPSAVPPLPPGAITIVTRDAAGAVLEQRSVEVVVGLDARVEQDELASFIAPMRVEPEPASFEILLDGQSVGTFDASANAPSAAWVSPAGGELIEGVAPIEWSADDADGDPLTASIAYSPDDGATWRGVILDHAGETFAMDTALLPGSDAGRLRLTVSDGLRSVEVLSEPFTVPNKTPLVDIRRPLADRVFAGASLLVLDASVWDVEDGVLDDEAVEWFSDLDGPLGGGLRTEVFVDDLMEGEHVLTARATDVDGGVTEASVTVVIVRIAEDETIEPTIYVDDLGFVVGGPLDGQPYAGILIGTDGPDVIRGTDGDDLIQAGGGDDLVLGQGGRDNISGNDGADQLFGGDGDDLLLGGNGDDLIEGGAGADILRGEDGSDSLSGDAGDDVLKGGAGDDVCIGGAGSDIVDGGDGDDECEGEVTSNCEG